MKNQVQLVLFLFFALFFGLTLLYVLPLVVPLANAAQLESGVEIIAPTTIETEKICDDTINNDNDGKIDGDDHDCVAGPKRPPPEIAEICGNGNDQDCVPPAGAAGETVPPADPAGGTCGLQIVDGVPINYGEAILEGNNSAWISENQIVTIKNVGTVDAEIVIKGGNWVSDAAGNPTVSGPDITHVAVSPLDIGDVAVDPLGILDPTVNPLNYEGKWSLPNNGISMGIIAPEKSAYKDTALLFQIKLAPLMLDGGTFHQEVSIDLLCGGNEFLKEDERKGDYNTSAKSPNTPSPVPIPYPDTNNTTAGMQIRAD